LIGYVRDIYFGHGERDLAYMMIYIWYKFYPVLAIYAFHQFVIGDFPYGCWNDIKYFCKFISLISDKGIHDPLINIAISCANHQLLIDMNDSIQISNLSKWIPRENKIEWLFEKLVVHWFRNFDLLHNYSSLSYKKKMYRQMIVSNCKRCLDNAATIANIFQSVNNGKGIINNMYKKSIIDSTHVYHNVFIGTYIKTAISIIDNFNFKNSDSIIHFDTCIEAIWLNHMWCQMLSFFNDTCYGGIPVIDISADISNESLYHAIGFACLLAIKSGIFRILLVSNTPIWIEFTKSDSICSLVDKIWSYCRYRSGSQFSVSFHLLMDAFSKISIINTSVKLFIFSQRFLFDWNHFAMCLGNKCSFVFWNIGNDCSHIKGDFFMDDHKEILFVSGFNTALFSKFYSNNLTGSYEFLLDSLHSQRYKRLSDYFDVQTSTGNGIGNGNGSTSSAASSNNS
jgi:hypothetical protein